MKLPWYAAGEAPEAHPPAGALRVLPAAGQRTLEKLLPGVVAQLADVGVHEVATPRDLVSLQGGRWIRRRPDGTSSWVSVS